MSDERKPYKRIPDNFETLLTNAARKRFRAIVVGIEDDWYNTANIIFSMGLDAWERQAAAIAEDNAAQAAMEAANE